MLAFAVDWSQLTIGTAALLVLVYVARTLRRSTADVIGMVKDISTTNQKFIGNHMSHVTEAVEHTAASLEDTSEILTLLVERVDRLHDDNVVAASVLASSTAAAQAAASAAAAQVQLTAEVLRKADETVTRKVQEQNNRG